jgi:hypothetical protein
MGFRYVGGEYQPMVPAADGSLVSAELGLRLCPEGDYLGLYDIKTGEKLLPMEDALRLLDVTQRQIASAEERIRQAERELEKERRKSAELESQVKRLRQSGKGKKA